MDAHYINEVLNGNTNAFSYFIRTYQNKAFGVAIAIVKDKDNAKDIVQDSFITAYSSLSNFRNEAKFSTWLYRIVVNKALLFVNREKRMDEVLLEYSLSNEDKATMNDALVQMEKEELKKLISRIFKKISPKEALILQLFYIDDLTIIEIEAITAYTKSNIKVLLHRGRASFYNKLMDQRTKEFHKNGD
jgi:RNA polymerase sigma-70 factor (ECF subfamily)